MNPRFIECGLYSGGGLSFSGTEDFNGLPVECTIEITADGKNFAISGFYRSDANGEKHSFTAVISRSLWLPRISPIEFHVHSLGSISGVATASRTGVLILGRSDDGKIQVSQRWDELDQKNCFGISGIVSQTQNPLIAYSLSFGRIDFRHAKSNVVALGDSA